MGGSAALSGGRRLEAGACLAGKLKLVRRIGEGGMGAVWVARNIATGADVAIKVLHPGRHEDAHAAERFRYEAQLGAKLAHRNITRVFDLFEEADGSLILVMELLTGETLRGYYRRKRTLPAKQAVAIVVGVLSGLQHAHGLGVVHRDVKPTNIFLHVDSDGLMTPKLLDFGIAKARDSSIETKTGDALGTPSYMSPEQVRAVDLDGRSDLFSVAVVLYEILAGESPFSGATATAVLAQVLELEVDPHPAIDPRVWLEIQRSLSKQAYQRHASAKDFAAALCTAVGETETALLASLREEVTALPRVEPFLDSGDTDAAGRVLLPTPSPAPATATGTLQVPVRSLRTPLAAGAVALLLLAGGLVWRGMASAHAVVSPGAAPDQPGDTSTAANAAVASAAQASSVEPPGSAMGRERAEPTPATALTTTPPVASAKPSPRASPAPPPVRTPAAPASKPLARKPGF